MEKLLIALLILAALVIIVLIIKLIKQKKDMGLIKTERDTIINLFKAISGHQEKHLSTYLINRTPESYLRYFGGAIRIYYEDLIRELSFAKLADLIYELEHAISDFRIKRQIMEIFSRAAAKIGTPYWAKLLANSIIVTPLIFNQEYEDKARRLEDFIIATATANKRLLLLENDFEDEVFKLCGMSENFQGTKEVEAAGILLEKIRSLTKELK